MFFQFRNSQLLIAKFEVPPAIAEFFRMYEELLSDPDNGLPDGVSFCSLSSFHPKIVLRFSILRKLIVI